MNTKASSERYGFDSFVDEFDRARVGNNAPEGKSVRPTRKKFAIPPVKVACLEW
jgi:hypothetical protein